MKFYRCKHCGNIIAYVKESGVKVVCCGEPMEELVPNTSDGAHEKHVPVYEKKDNKVIVNVGAIDHPMVDVHYIEWVALETNKGNQRKALKPNQAPRVEFCVDEDEQVLAVYAYCNLHGLYKN